MTEIGKPQVITALSSATTGRPDARASWTSGWIITPATPTLYRQPAARGVDDRDRQAAGDHRAFQRDHRTARRQGFLDFRMDHHAGHADTVPATRRARRR